MRREQPFDPPAQLTALCEIAPISRVRIWDGSTPWLVTGYHEQRAALASPLLSSDPAHDGMPHLSAPAAQPGQRSASFINMDGERHSAFRRALARHFTVSSAEARGPAIQHFADQLVTEMLEGPRPIDLVNAFALPLPSLVICDLLGVPAADRPLFERCTRLLMSRESDPEASLRAAATLRDYLIELVTAKRAAPGDDLLGKLTVTEVGSARLTDAELVEIADLLLVAGHETTANMIALGALALMRHPDQLALLRSGMTTEELATAVDELLRYLTIMHSGRRRVAVGDLTIGGTLIRAGEGVILANDAGNRDKRAFGPDPDKLDLRRVARNHLAFGGGPHHCLAHALARVELRIAYQTLFRRIPTLRTVLPFEQLGFRNEMVVYGVNALPVTWCG